MQRTDYDHAYKYIFSEPMMVEHLITCFFDEAWVKDLDFSTLQRLNTEHTTDDYRERESDIVWKVQWEGQWLYLLILIEFQSTVDQFMAVRLMSYISLMYQDIIKQDAVVRRSKQLPPVLPMVLYMGDKPWNAPLNFNQYVSDKLPNLLKKYQPSLEYWLLEESRCIIDSAREKDNLVASLVGLEQCTEFSELQVKFKRLMERLKGPEFDSIRRAFAVFGMRILRERHQFSGSAENLTEEDNEMLSRKIEIWKQEFIEQGMQQGMQQGEFEVLKRQIMKRFGSLTAEQERKLMSKTSDELLKLSDRILDAQSINEIFS